MAVLRTIGKDMGDEKLIVLACVARWVAIK